MDGGATIPGLSHQLLFLALLDTYAQILAKVLTVVILQRQHLLYFSIFPLLDNSFENVRVWQVREVHGSD